MRINSRVSKMTLRYSSVLSVAGIFLASAPAFSGSTGTPEAEQSRLADEVAAARNALDAIVLKPGMKLDDPRVREKAAILEEKTKAFRKGFQDSIAPQPGPKTYPNSSSEKEDHEGEDGREEKIIPLNPVSTPPRKIETPSEPETVLSGDGIQSEISYPLKQKASEEKPSDSPSPKSDGLSEIRYPKKTGKKTSQDE
jgi:hypothetical protein